MPDDKVLSYTPWEALFFLTFDYQSVNCKSLKICVKRWKEVERKGRNKNVMAVLPPPPWQKPPIPWERTVRPGSQPTYKYTKKKSKYLCFWRFFLYSPGVIQVFQTLLHGAYRLLHYGRFYLQFFILSVPRGVGYNS